MTPLEEVTEKIVKYLPSVNKRSVFWTDISHAIANILEEKKWKFNKPLHMQEEETILLLNEIL